MARQYILMAFSEEDRSFYQHFLMAEQRIIQIPPAPSENGYDPNMTFGEAINKKVAPPGYAGMKPAWSEKAREKYEKCIQPSLDAYKFAVDKINREAWKNYDNQTDQYMSRGLAFSGMASIFGAAKGDGAIKVQYQWKNRGFVTGGNRNARILFWATFIWETRNYINLRLSFLEHEKQDFIAQTEFFIKKVNQCRNENPYDIWMLKTAEERNLEIDLENVTFFPHYVKHQNKWLEIPSIIPK